MGSTGTTMLGSIALAVLSAAPLEVAHAYSDPTYYTELTENGGGGGRWFTGSSADGYGCQVCHLGGGDGAQISISGVPLDGFTPGSAYEIGLLWPAEVEHLALIAEFTDELRQGAGTLALPRPDAFKPAELCAEEGLQGFPPSAITEFDAGRQLVSVIDCGARTLRFQWTAPALAQGPVWLDIGFVTSDADGTPAGDSVTMVRRPIPIAGQTLPEHAIAKSGCSIQSSRDTRPSALANVVCLSALAALFARRRARSRMDGEV